VLKNTLRRQPCSEPSRQQHGLHYQLRKINTRGFGGPLSSFFFLSKFSKMSTAPGKKRKRKKRKIEKAKCQQMKKSEISWNIKILRSRHHSLQNPL
jgi:hypothetical protein